MFQCVGVLLATVGRDCASRYNVGIVKDCRFTIFCYASSMPRASDQTKPRYVVWNGKKLARYFEEVQSYAIPQDAGHLTMRELKKVSMSAQQLRRELIKKGGFPVLILSSGSGKASYETVIKGKQTSLFNYCWSEITEKFPQLPLKVVISKVNALMRKWHPEQTCEAICTEETLSRTIGELMILPYALLIFDMCRTPVKPDETVL